MRNHFAFGLLVCALVSQPVAAQVIKGCVDNNKGTLRILGASESCDAAKEHPISWNQEGVAGKDGTNGTNGVNGINGRDGRDGQNCTTPAVPAPVQIGTLTITPDGGTAIGPVPIYQFSGGSTQTLSIGSATGGAGAGKVSFNPITIVKKLDSSSPAIFTMLATGRLSSVLIGLNKPGTTVQNTVNLTIAALSSSNVVQLPGSSDFFEAISIEYGRISYVIDGASSCWDRIRNVSCGP